MGPLATFSLVFLGHQAVDGPQVKDVLQVE
jgi:hypothetical protein